MLLVSMVIISNSIVLLAITIYLVDFHEIVVLPKRNTYLVVDFTFVVSLTQLASVYPSITSGYPLKWRS